MSRFEGDNALLPGALALAGLGYRVHPCRGKAPILTGWPELATTDAATIREWWSRHHGASVGIATGKGIVAIDIDGPDGEASLSQLVGERGELPPTVESVTGRPDGGRHLLFRLADGVTVKSMTGFRTKLDVKADGGQIIAPPSIHPDTRMPYRWLDGHGPQDLEPAELPRAWVEALTRGPDRLAAVRQACDAIEALGADGDAEAVGAALNPIRGLRLNEADRETSRAMLVAAVKGAGVQAPTRLVDALLRRDRGEAREGGEESQTDVLSRLVGRAGVTLFHDGDRELATVPVGNHQETLPLRGRSARAWLRRLYHEETRAATGAQAVEAVAETMAARARFDGPNRSCAVRVQGDEGVVRLDLCNDSWEYVEITAAGWSVAGGAADYFRRTTRARPLPAPEHGERLSLLRGHLNALNDDVWHLIAGWLVAALRPSGPYPILIVNGEHGSAKTTCCEMLVRCLDPGKAPLRTPPRDLRDLAVGADAAWTVGFDNLGMLSPTLSDGLCRLATGSGFATRALYTDGDEVIFEATRPIIINGIGEIASRPDLLDRAYVATLPAFAGMQQPHSDVWRAFEADLPMILGGLCDAVSAALRLWSATPAPADLRMQDAARWVEASAQMWTTPGAPLAAVRRSRAEVNAAAAESSPVAVAVETLLDGVGGEWEGTMTELLAALVGAIAPDARDAVVRRKDWPASPESLSRKLWRLAPVLRARGVYHERLPRTGGKRRLALKRGEQPSQPSLLSSPSKNVGGIGDSCRDSCRDGSAAARHQPSPTVTDRHSASARNDRADDRADDSSDGCDGSAGALGWESVCRRRPPTWTPPPDGRVRVSL